MTRRRIRLCVHHRPRMASRHLNGHREHRRTWAKGRKPCMDQLYRFEYYPGQDFDSLKIMRCANSMNASYMEADA